MLFNLESLAPSWATVTIAGSVGAHWLDSQTLDSQQGALAQPAAEQHWLGLGDQGTVGPDQLWQQGLLRPIRPGDSE